jgi:hypothetical protein
VTELERALSLRGEAASLGDELKALDKISKTSRDPEELSRCARRCSEIEHRLGVLNARAFIERSRLLRECAAYFGPIHLGELGEYRNAVDDRIAELRGWGA